QPALSVAVVVVLLEPGVALVLVVVVARPALPGAVDEAVVLLELEVESLAGAVVVGGAVKVCVSPASEVRLVDGVALRLVQLRAVSQLLTAFVSGVPVRGCGSPARMVAGRQVAPVICRPTTVRMSEPLEVSGAVLS